MGGGGTGCCASAGPDAGAGMLRATIGDCGGAGVAQAAIRPAKGRMTAILPEKCPISTAPGCRNTQAAVPESIRRLKIRQCASNGEYLTFVDGECIPTAGGRAPSGTGASQDAPGVFAPAGLKAGEL